jgi:tetratricopeptide (TPR) repeat protein
MTTETANSCFGNRRDYGINESDSDDSDDIDDTSFYTTLDLDKLVLETFESSGKDYKLPSIMRERMLEEQEMYLAREVIFYRPDKSTEGRDIRWCLDNECLEVGDDLWSGPWYFDSKEGWDRACEMDSKKQEQIKQRHVSHLQESAMKFTMESADFENILKFKSLGNTMFGSKKYREAIKLYDMALELFLLPLGPVPAKQLQEQVNILSNKSESLLRLKQYIEAQMAATDAILLDCHHVKSLLRRAKATFYDAEIDSHGELNPMAWGMAMEDLNTITELGGEGAKEVERLELEMLDIESDDECDGQQENENGFHQTRTNIPKKSFKSRRTAGDGSSKKLMKLLTERLSIWPSRVDNLHLGVIDKFNAFFAFLEPSIMYSVHTHHFEHEDDVELVQGLNMVKFHALSGADELPGKTPCFAEPPAAPESDVDDDIHSNCSDFDQLDERIIFSPHFSKSSGDFNVYESEDDHDYIFFTTKFDLDKLVLEAFKRNGKDYKLPSTIRERMLEDQEIYLSRVVTFYRSDKSTEGKDIRWCLDNGFLEVGDDLWSGPWYFESKDEWDRACKMHSNNKEKLKKRLRDCAKRLTVNPTDYEKILNRKLCGNTMLSSKRYKEAVEHYDKALELFPFSMGPVPAKQLDEQVSILSNKAESLLRLEQYLEAQMAATEALLLDCTHVKSLLRRAKATFRGLEIGIFDWIYVGKAVEDLDTIISLGGEGMAEAENLKSEIELSTKADVLQSMFLQMNLLNSMFSSSSPPPLTGNVKW